jgi:hypothetical protein
MPQQNADRTTQANPQTTINAPLNLAPPTGKGVVEVVGGASDSPSPQGALFSLGELLETPRGLAAPNLLVACSPRRIFPREGHFELTLLQEPRVLAALSRTLGTTVRDLHNQVVVPASRQRADVLGQTNHPDATVVLELTLEPLDADHYQRGLSYAINLAARHLVLVAASFPEAMVTPIARTRAWLERFGSPFTIHLLQINTWLDGKGGCHYALEAVDPGRVLPLRNRARLEAVAARVAELGDRSLASLSVIENRLFESYAGLPARVRIRVYAGNAQTTLSVFVDPDRLSALERTLDRVALDRDIRALGGSVIPSGGASVLVNVAVPTPADQSQPDSVAVDCVARVYVRLRTALLEALNDQVDLPFVQPTFHGLIPPRAA